MRRTRISVLAESVTERNLHPNNGKKRMEESDDGNMVFPDEWGIKIHQHDYYELMYVLKGEVKQQIEGSTYLYQKGEGCFVNRNTNIVKSPEMIFLLCIYVFPKNISGDFGGNRGKKSGEDSIAF